MWVLLASRRLPAGSPPVPAGFPPAPLRLPAGVCRRLLASRRHLLASCLQTVKGTSPVLSPLRPTSNALPFPSLTCLALPCSTLPVFACPPVFQFSCFMITPCICVSCQLVICFHMFANVMFARVHALFVYCSEHFYLLSREWDSTRPCRLRRTFVEMIAAVLLKK